MKTDKMYSQNCNNVQPSFIREILKTTQNKSTISFAGGLPDPTLFPYKEIQIATQNMFLSSSMQALQYGTTEGIPMLKQWIIDRYQNQYNIEISQEEILITSGSQQGLELIAKAFLDLGDKIMMEEKSYLGAIQCFSAHTNHFITIQSDTEGPITKDLEKGLENNPDTKLFYAVPTFQNPTGSSYSANRREEIYKTFKDKNTLFIEDDPYREIWFDSPPLPPLKKEMGDQCIYLGSFSKSIAPGFRIGFVIAEKGIIRELTKLKQAQDLHTSTFNQYILYQYLIEGNFDNHIKRIQQSYQKRYEFMYREIQRQFPKGTIIYEAKGGMFIWVELPEKFDTTLILEKCILENVVYVPGEIFYPNNKKKNGMRLNFSNSTKASIKKGIEIIAKNLK